MRNKKLLVVFASVLLIGARSHAQTVAQMSNAVKVMDEGGHIDTVSIAGAVLQFGTGTTWAPPFVLDKSMLPLQISYVIPNPTLAAVDPAPNMAKEIDAQRTTVDYVVNWTDAGGDFMTTKVSALAVGPPVTTPPVVPAVCTATPLPDANPVPTGVVCPAPANAVRICGDGETIVDLRMGTPVLFVYGAGQAWNPPFMFIRIPLLADGANALIGGDPAKGVAKEIDALRAERDFTVTYKDMAGVLHDVLVPALAGS